MKRYLLTILAALAVGGALNVVPAQLLTDNIGAGVALAQQNQPPIWNMDQVWQAQPGVGLHILLMAHDPENMPLEYSVDADLPEGAVFSPEQRTITWIPAVNQIGSYIITVSAFDGINESVPFDLGIVVLAPGQGGSGGGGSTITPTPAGQPPLVATSTPTSTPPTFTRPQCSDGIDNDGDKKIDYPADPGCTGPQDNNETDPAPIVKPKPIIIPPKPKATSTLLINASTTSTLIFQPAGAVPPGLRPISTSTASATIATTTAATTTPNIIWRLTGAIASGLRKAWSWLVAPKVEMDCGTPVYSHQVYSSTTLNVATYPTAVSCPKTANCGTGKICRAVLIQNPYCQNGQNCGTIPTCKCVKK